MTRPELVVKQDFFALHVCGDVLLVVLHNTEAMPSINYHALSTMFDTMRATLVERGMTAGGWSVVYDFSAVTGYEITAAMAFPNFYRWARQNGRRKAAHILPRRDGGESISVIKRLILGQVAPGGAGDDHYEASDRDDALAWIARVTAQR